MHGAELSLCLLSAIFSFQMQLSKLSLSKLQPLLEISPPLRLYLTAFLMNEGK